MADGKLTLEIATPQRLIFTREVDEVVLPSLDGYMGVLQGHAPLLASLEIGEISFRVGNERTYLCVANGFAEVLRDGVQVLAEVCEPAEEIDVERARRAKERAETRLASDAADVEFARARASLARAVTRIQTHSRLG